MDFTIVVILIPFIDRMVKVGLRTIVMDITPQDVITRDNVSLKVNAVLYFRVIDPAAIQLRYLQTLAEVAAETNSTTIFPMPIDFFKILLSRNEN
jgi:regulator of protease activity HflC (stomatin/prohibitin superfamily)